jgi:uncharacterized protein YndB with AHSA1/START domain
MTNNFVFETDLAAKKIFVIREFNAPVEKVWKAWTDPDLLVKWIAPKPWTAVIKIWDFTVGGIWLYALVDTDGKKPWWTHMEFTAIEDGRAFSTTGKFADENGNTAPDGPKSYRDVKFSTLEGNRSQVDMVITFTNEATIKMFVEGGFKEGTAVTLNQIDELLASE